MRVGTAVILYYALLSHHKRDDWGTKLMDGVGWVGVFSDPAALCLIVELMALIFKLLSKF